MNGKFKNPTTSQSMRPNVSTDLHYTVESQRNTLNVSGIINLRMSKEQKFSFSMFLYVFPAKGVSQIRGGFTKMK